MRGGKARLFREGLASAAVANGREGFGWSSAGSEAAADGVPVQAENARPLHQGERSPRMLQNDVVSPVVLLNSHRSPAHVAGLVALGVVQAVDRKARRLLAHIRQKGRIIMAPAVTDRNAPGAVFVECSRGWRIATVDDRAPHFIGRGVTKTVGAIAFGALGGLNIAVQAAARPALAGLKNACADDALLAAFAATMPLRDSGDVIFGTAQNCPPPKAQAGQALKCWHGLDYNNPCSWAPEGIS